MDAAMRGRRGLAEFWIGVTVDALVRAPGEHMRMYLHDLRYAARAPCGARRCTPSSPSRRWRSASAPTPRSSAWSTPWRSSRCPFADPSRLVRLWEKNDKLRIPRFSASVPNYYSWRERAQSFERARRVAQQQRDAHDRRRSAARRQAGGHRGPAAAARRPADRRPRVHRRTKTAPAAPHVAMLAESVWRKPARRIGRRPGTADRPRRHPTHRRSASSRDRDFVLPVQRR